MKRHVLMTADTAGGVWTYALELTGARLSALWWTPFGQVEVGGEGSTLGDRRAIVVLGTWF